jgi:hypothetical protein
MMSTYIEMCSLEGGEPFQCTGTIIESVLMSTLLDSEQHRNDIWCVACFMLIL